MGMHSCTVAVVWNFLPRLLMAAVRPCDTQRQLSPQMSVPVATIPSRLIRASRAVFRPFPRTGPARAQAFAKGREGNQMSSSAVLPGELSLERLGQVHVDAAAQLLAEAFPGNDEQSWARALGLPAGGMHAWMRRATVHRNVII